MVKGIHSLTKTKVGQKWYQLIALSLMFSAGFFCFYLKGHYSLKSTKPVSAFNDHKNSFAGSM
jgi:hypothetical protein